jgi:AraC-like DNA-binding protein
MNPAFPVYSINEFQSQNPDSDFYANYFSPHVKTHHFTNLPHKHDFYLIVLITKGSGRHEIDFESFDVAPGALFILRPGQMHFWELSDDIDGYVFFHSRDFYDKHSVGAGLKNFEFYSSFQNAPCVHLAKTTMDEISLSMRQLVLEKEKNDQFKWEKVHALITIIYVTIARQYSQKKEVKSTIYLQKARLFEDLIEANFKSIKFARDYAQMLNTSEKHLNRITKSCFDKTSTQLIGERILLEAKRMLMHSEFNVTQIGDELGFKESSYFIRFFKKHTGTTPLTFLNTYENR